MTDTSIMISDDKYDDVNVEYVDMLLDYYIMLCMSLLTVSRM
jgi:hypothetical protein